MTDDDRKAVWSALAAMEGDVHEVMAWANAFQAAGMGHSMIDPEAILVMGKALDNLAGSVIEKYETAIALVKS